MKTSENPGIDLILAKQRQIAAAEEAAKAKERFLYEARIKAFKDTGIPAIVESLKDVKMLIKENDRVSKWLEQTDTYFWDLMNPAVILRSKRNESEKMIWFVETDSDSGLTKYVWMKDPCNIWACPLSREEEDKKTFKSPDELREHFVETMAAMLPSLDESV